MCGAKKYVLIQACQNSRVGVGSVNRCEHVCGVVWVQVYGSRVGVGGVNRCEHVCGVVWVGCTFWQSSEGRRCE